MERLTMPKGICQMVSTEYCIGHRDCYECSHGRKVFKSLAEYEDTGLTPEEITATQAELAEYRKKEADGRLVEVVRCKDCALLDTINCFTSVKDGNGGWHTPRMAEFCANGEAALMAQEGAE